MRLGLNVGDTLVVCKDIWDITGASGLKPCGLKCVNVAMKARAGSLGRDMLCISSCRFKDGAQAWQLVTDEELYEQHDELCAALARWQQRQLTKGAFERMETCAGLHANALGVMGSIPLRRVISPTGTYHDPMHSFFSNGIALWGVDLLYKQLKKDGFIDEGRIKTFLAAGWRWLGARNGSSAGFWFNSHGLKGGATASLHATHLLRYYVHVVVPAMEQNTAQINSFKALHAAVATWRDFKFGDAAKRYELQKPWQEQLDQYLELHVTAYGLKEVKTKHHYSGHLPDQTDYLDTFVTERFQKVIKEYCDHFYDTSQKRYELAVVTKANQFLR